MQETRLKKRERTQNWNKEEKEELFKLCSAQYAIIENKRYDARNTEAKSRVWFIIHQNFSSQFGKERSVNRLKEQWRRMKAAARSEVEEYNSSRNFNSDNNNKPSALCFKIYNLLTESKRLCENNDLSKNMLFPLMRNDEGIKTEHLEENLNMDEILASSKNNTGPNIKYRLNPLNDEISDQITQVQLFENRFNPKIFSSPLNLLDYGTSLRSAWSDFPKQEFLKEEMDLSKTNKLKYQNILYKEHAMRMKVFEAQQEHIARSTELINLCTKAAINCFNGFL